MEKFADLFWWVLTVMVLPLDGSIIIANIYEGNFNSSFWFTVVIYIVLCIGVGLRLYLLEKRKEN